MIKSLSPSAGRMLKLCILFFTQNRITLVVHVKIVSLTYVRLKKTLVIINVGKKRKIKKSLAWLDIQQCCWSGVCQKMF